MANVQELIDETLGLQHYGIKGQKWGKRRYQNEDGTYTEEGKKRRRVGYTEEAKEKDEKKVEGKTYKDLSWSEKRALKKKARHDQAAREERKEFNRMKREALENADLKFVSDNINKFSNDELVALADRYKKMQAIQDLEKATRKDSDYFIDKAIHYLDKASKLTNSITSIRDRINESNTKAINKQKAQYDYDKALHPEKYEKKKSTAELEKDALDLQQKRDAARKAKADADASEEKARLNKLTADKADSKYQEELKKEEKFKEDEREQDRIAEQRKLDEKLQKDLEKVDRRYEPLSAKIRRLFNPADDDNISLDSNETEVSGRNRRENLLRKVLGSGKDYSLYKANRDRQYNLDNLDETSQKAIKKINKSSRTAEGVTKQDKKWKKDMRKRESDVIDKWVRDMKRKYIAAGLSPETAEKKAEAYVDSWIDAYDEGRITGLKK